MAWLFFAHHCGSEAPVHDRADHVFRHWFLVASLFGLVLIPLVHNRAVRLTMRRLEAATPLSMAEIQADKDQLRAEFAMSTRRLEMSRRADEGQDHQPARRARQEDRRHQPPQGRTRRENRRHLLAGGTRKGAEGPAAARPRTNTRSRSARCAKPSACCRQAGRAGKARLRSRRALGDRRQPARRARSRCATQVEALKDRVSDHEREANEIERPARPRAQGRRRRDRRTQEERGKVEKLGDRVSQLERQLVAQTTEAEVLGRRVQELEAPDGRPGAVLSEREIEIDQLRDKIDEGAEDRSRPARGAVRRGRPQQVPPPKA